MSATDSGAYGGRSRIGVKDAHSKLLPIQYSVPLIPHEIPLSTKLTPGPRSVSTQSIEANSESLLRHSRNKESVKKRRYGSNRRGLSTEKIPSHFQQPCHQIQRRRRTRRHLEASRASYNAEMQWRANFEALDYWCTLRVRQLWEQLCEITARRNLYH